MKYFCMLFSVFQKVTFADSLDAKYGRYTLNISWLDESQCVDAKMKWNKAFLEMINSNTCMCYISFCLLSSNDDRESRARIQAEAAEKRAATAMEADNIDYERQKYGFERSDLFVVVGLVLWYLRLIHHHTLKIFPLVKLAIFSSQDIQIHNQSY